MMSPVYHFTIYLCLSLLKFTFRRWSCTCMWHLVYLCGLCLVLYTQTPPSLSSSQARGGPQRYTVSTWLQIQNLHLSDAGIYSCISHNALGETSASARLTVLRQGETGQQILSIKHSICKIPVQHFIWFVMGVFTIGFFIFFPICLYIRAEGSERPSEWRGWRGVLLWRHWGRERWWADRIWRLPGMNCGSI